MKKISKALDYLEDGLSTVLILAICAVIVIQVVLRATGLPLKWTEESARFLFVWLIYISVSQAVRARRHLSVDIVPLLLRENGKSILRIISNLICIVFFAMIAYFGVQVIQRFIALPQRSQAIGMNMTIPYLAPYVGSALAVIRYIIDTIEEIGVLLHRGKEAV